MSPKHLGITSFSQEKIIVFDTTAHTYCFKPYPIASIGGQIIQVGPMELLALGSKYSQKSSRSLMQIDLKLQTQQTILQLENDFQNCFIC
jgi:hypothetical protein